jgi:hypothetical protein
MKVSKTKHVTILKIVDDQLGPSKQDYSNLGVFGVLPKKGIDIFDSSSSYENLSGQKLVFLAKVEDFRTFEPDNELQNLDRFNREINVKKCIDFLNKKGPSGIPFGFNYDYCGFIVATLKKDQKTKQWYLFVNQGQHRVAMAYLSMGRQAYLPVLVQVPSESHTEEDILVMEAMMHHVDASVRTGQKITDKLRSGWICGDETSKEIVDFYNDVGVNVANLLAYEKKCDSWQDISLYIKDFGREKTYRAMSSISKYCDENTIHARAIGGLVALSYYFESKVQDFERQNDKDFFETVCKYAFKERPRIVKMNNLTKGTGNQKHIAWPMTLWINLVNDMVDTKSFKKSGNSNFWIGKKSKCWQEFLENELGDDPLAEILNQKVEPNVI